MSEINFNIILNCIDSSEMRIIFLLLCQNFLWPPDSQNFGVYGDPFEIAEEDFWQHMINALETSKSIREAKIEQNETREKFRQNKTSLTNPLQEITETEKLREYKFDPTIVVNQDFTDSNGKILVKAGEKFNPLDRIKMSPILFINGENQKHVDWALKKINDRKIFKHNFAKIVLVEGASMDLQMKLQRRIFFDQHGILIKKLGIKHVPAIIFHNPQEKMLTIREEVV